ncbi:MAG: hypothetical protein P1U77_25460 [Rubripirellula sp.]|nr:hypothetical protein [Rubripirellula sp.]
MPICIKSQPDGAINGRARSRLIFASPMRRVPHRISVLPWSVLLVLSTGVLTSIGCNSAVRSITREPQPLAYVGQVQLGEPTNEDGTVVVPLNYVDGQWLQNSAIVPIDVETTINDSEIEMTVVTSVATEGGTEKGRRLILPEDTTGEFEVYYRDPNGVRHQIGVVLIKK